MRDSVTVLAGSHSRFPSSWSLSFLINNNPNSNTDEQRPPPRAEGQASLNLHNNINRGWLKSARFLLLRKPAQRKAVCPGYHSYEVTTHVEAKDELEEELWLSAQNLQQQHYLPPAPKATLSKNTARGGM